jgi:hypothetical protein
MQPQKTPVRIQRSTDGMIVQKRMRPEPVVTDQRKSERKGKEEGIPRQGWGMFRTALQQVGVLIVCGFVVFCIAGYYAHRADIVIVPKTREVRFILSTHFASRMLQSGVHISYASQSYSNQDQHFVEMAGYPYYLPIGGTTKSILLGSRSDIDALIRRYITDKKLVEYPYVIDRYHQVRGVFAGYDPGSDRLIGFLSGSVTLRALPDYGAIRSICSNVAITGVEKCLSSDKAVLSASVRSYPRFWNTLPKREFLTVKGLIE